MSDLGIASAEILRDAGFTTMPMTFGSRPALAFENATVLGFLFSYSSVAELLDSWESDANNAVTANQLALRRAGQKAWNTYTIFLSTGPADARGAAGLSAIEEDLGGTRKIARANVADTLDIRAALLPLLPLQAAPKLDSVDSPTEIRERSTELPQRAIDAFLSTADESVVLSVLEESS